MTKDDCEELLRRWGSVYGQQRPGEWQEDVSPTGDSPLARVMEMAPGKANRSIDAAYKRRSRPGERSWSRDPIVCTESRHAVGSPAMGMTDKDPMVGRVQAAWFALVRADDRTAEVIRLEYQTRATQTEKAKGLEISKGRYREMLAEGRGFMWNSLTVL